MDDLYVYVKDSYSLILAQEYLYEIMEQIENEYVEKIQRRNYDPQKNKGVHIRLIPQNLYARLLTTNNHVSYRFNQSLLYVEPHLHCVAQLKVHAIVFSLYSNISFLVGKFSNNGIYGFLDLTRGSFT